jgi:ferrous iron transport protein A
LLRRFEIPLAFAKEGEEYEIVGINGGGGIRRRLEEMGIFPGRKIKLISNSAGPLMLGIGDNRIAVGRGIAFKIIVR